MSRFFRGDSDSDSDDSSGSETSSPVVQKAPTRFTRGAVDSDSDDDTPQKRVVKSAKEKAVDELESTNTSIRNSIKNNNWDGVDKDFEKLNTALAKVVKILNEVPQSYIKTLVILEDAHAKASESKDKKPGKSFGNVKSALKRNNAKYQDKIAEYRKNPDADAAGSDSEEEESSEDEKPVAKTQAKAKPAPPAKNRFFKGAADSDDEDEDDSDSMDDSDDESSDSSSGGEGGPSNRGKWFKKAPAAKETPEPVKKTKDKVVKQKPTPGQDVPSVKEQPTKEMSPEQLDKKLQELVESRGRKGTARMGQVEQFEALTQHAKTDDKLITILVHLIDAQFDVNTSAAANMSVTLWKSTLSNLNRLLLLLEKNPSITLAEGPAAGKPRTSEDGEIIVSGNLLAFVERLDEEFTRSLQNIDDPHTNEYVQRLRDEQGFIDLAEHIQNYYERLNNKPSAARVASRRLEHLYYKHEKDVKALALAASKEPKPEVADYELKALIHHLAYLVYAHGDERLRARTMLMHIYHHALHDRFYEARDMMLMSHLQETIHLMDVPTQILFNRTMVQLGLCAFRNNLIVEAHSCLADICGGGRVKELLAQGVTNTQRFGEKNAEQEKQEKKRLVPFHMHISLELLECVHLISAMLLEVPNMAQNPFDLKKKIISRAFRRLLDYFDRQVFTGPPENNRDFVAAASKALSTGDWQVCESLLLSLKVWALMPNVETVKANLRRRIQEEGLRTYLFTYSNFYDSMNLSELSSMFDLAPNAVHSLISKMIINEELYASWDQPTGSIIMQRAEPTKLQYLALQFAEKAAVFVENNERLLDTRTGGYGYSNKDNQGKQGGGAKERGQWQEGGGWGQYNRQPYQQYQQGGAGGGRGRQFGQHQQRHQQDGGRFQSGGGGKRYDRGERSDYGGGHYRKN